MKFEIKGANRDTGDEMSVIIEASTPSAAEEQANQMNILVERIEVVSPAPTAVTAPVGNVAPGAKTTERETVLLEVHPSMFRNHPIAFVFCMLLILDGVIMLFNSPGTGLIVAGLFDRPGTGLIVAGLGILILLWWWLKCLGTTLTVTNTKTTLRNGLLSKHTNEVRHQDIRNLQVGQGILQRLFGVGRLSVSSAAQSDIEISVGGIADPQRVKKLIDDKRGA